MQSFATGVSESLEVGAEESHKEPDLSSEENPQNRSRHLGELVWTDTARKIIRTAVRTSSFKWKHAVSLWEPITSRDSEWWMSDNQRVERFPFLPTCDQEVETQGFTYKKSLEYISPSVMLPATCDGAPWRNIRKVGRVKGCDVTCH